MTTTARKKYETDNGSVFYVELDGRDNALTAAGDEPTGDPTENMTVYAGKNNAKNGIRARQILYARLIGTEGTNADGYITSGRAYKRLPILTKTTWDAFTVGQLGDTEADTLEIGGTTFYAVKKIAEDID